MTSYMAEKYHEEVLQETWGHLAPRKNATYYGSITYAVGCYGNDRLNPTILQVEFKTHDGQTLEDSPWFFNELQEFIHSDACPKQSGQVYRFTGTFRNYKFNGKGVTLPLNTAQQKEATVKRIRTTSAKLAYGHGWIVLVSYDTPVAAISSLGVLYVTDTKYSVTTSRHINEFIREQPWQSQVSRDEAFFRDLLKRVQQPEPVE